MVRLYLKTNIVPFVFLQFIFNLCYIALQTFLKIESTLHNSCEIRMYSR